MTPPAPWSPTAHAFAQHQFSHVANFWKQGRQASLRIEALPGGRAELNVTFQLPPSSEVIPPPSHPGPTKQRPIHPLFPGGFSPHGHASGPKSKPATEKKLSSKQRKSYRRSVLHRAALAVPSLPAPKDGSLRHAALASVQQLRAASASAVSTNKRPFPNSPNGLSPSNLPPLSQRIRKDIQIGENEVESPEKEILRSPSFLENSPPLNPPHYVQGVPPPAPLFFTPPKSHERSEMPANIAEEVSDEKVVALEGSESDMEKFDENDSEDAHEASAKEDEVVVKMDKEDGVVGKSDEVVGKSELSEQAEQAEQVEQEVYYCNNCGLEVDQSPPYYWTCIKGRLEMYCCYNCGLEKQENARLEEEVQEEVVQEEEQQHEEKCWNCEGKFSSDHQCYT